VLTIIKLFGKDQFLFSDLNDMLFGFLGPLDPIIIDYPMPPDTEYHNHKIAYEMNFEIDDPMRGKLNGVMNGDHVLKDIVTFDEKV
jgi:chromatin remodeling complex protein RSC6